MTVDRMLYLPKHSAARALLTAAAHPTTAFLFCSPDNPRAPTSALLNGKGESTAAAYDSASELWDTRKPLRLSIIMKRPPAATMRASSWDLPPTSTVTVLSTKACSALHVTAQEDTTIYQ